jgi:hypothetical protein
MILRAQSTAVLASDFSPRLRRLCPPWGYVEGPAPGAHGRDQLWAIDSPVLVSYTGSTAAVVVPLYEP